MGQLLSSPQQRVLPLEPSSIPRGSTPSMGQDFLLVLLIHNQRHLLSTRNEPDDILSSPKARQTRRELEGNFALGANKKLHNHVSTHHLGNVAAQGQKAAAWQAVTTLWQHRIFAQLMCKVHR